MFLDFLYLLDDNDNEQWQWSCDVLCQTCIIQHHRGALDIGKDWHLISPRFCNARKESSRGANNRAVEKKHLNQEEEPGGRPEGAVVADAAVVLLNAVVVVCPIVRHLDNLSSA